MPNILAAANRTGYPLQAALEAIVRAGYSKHGLTVRGHECHWRDPQSGESRFVDILLTGVCLAPFGRFALQRLAVIECKRIDGYWTFPVATPSPQHLDEVRLLTTLFDKEGGTHFRSWGYGPEGTHRSEYCTLSQRTPQGAEQHDSRTLEPWVTELLTACHVFATQPEVRTEPDGNVIGIVYVPILVTTATLHVLQYDPRTVSLHDGRLQPPPATQSHDVPYVVLAKDLGFEPGLSVWPSLGRTTRQPHQDVFIVNAAHLDVFLGKCLVVEEGRA